MTCDDRCKVSGCLDVYCVTVRYDMIEEFNVDSKAECSQLNLALETKTNKCQYPKIIRAFIS